MLSDQEDGAKPRKLGNRRRMIPRMMLASTDRKKHNCLEDCGGNKHPNVIQQYDNKFGKLEKFIKGQSSIDRFCKQYILNNRDPGLSIITSSNVGLLEFRSLSDRRPKTNECQQRSHHANHAALRHGNSKSKERTLDDAISVTNISKGGMSILHEAQIKAADCECIIASKEVMMGRSNFHKSMDTLSNFSNGYSILDGPARAPCRRLCSTIHNPINHHRRFNAIPEATGS